MRISSPDGRSFLEWNTPGPAITGPLAVTGTIQSEVLRGELTGTFAREEADRFAYELRAVMSGRSNAAVLDSLSEDELRVTVLTPDITGVVVVHIAYQSRRPIGARPFESSYSTGFGISGDALKDLADGFARWAATGR